MASGYSVMAKFCVLNMFVYIFSEDLEALQLDSNHVSPQVPITKQSYLFNH